MPLNSVQQYLKGILNGLPVPFYNNPLTVYIAPPVVDDLVGPTLYIWGSRWNESRQTMPRPDAFKKVVYQMDGFLKCPDASDYAFADNAFPAVIDTITKTLNTTPMPLTLTDSVTGLESQLISVGETISGDYSPLHVLDDQRWVMYECQLIMQVEEVISYQNV